MNTVARSPLRRGGPWGFWGRCGWASDGGVLLPGCGRRKGKGCTGDTWETHTRVLELRRGTCARQRSTALSERQQPVTENYLKQRGQLEPHELLK